ncbi:MAG: tetratricopeptide repeat protein [Actinobacteria bacterium]|nr:tetratricopeptide repeat protein [Actinomycetota bacterium]
MSDAQPSGTVTLVFTDVEGSTQLLEELGTDAYREALGEHRRVVREAFRARRGYEVDYEGDAFFYAFASAQAAVSAVSEAMIGLDGGPIRIRVGIHTGEPALDPPKYVGMDVHRAARIMSAAHGGQVVLSPSTVSLLEPASFELTDLGEHRLKDLSASERVYQLGEGVFPVLKSLYRTNLPVPATPFLGRELELQEVVKLLSRDEGRLLTLTGPGGTGKTRLAAQAAGLASDRYPDGVWWVPLAPLRDPTLVLSSVAQALEIREEPGRELVETIASRLAGKRPLVLLDNAEHLLPQLAADVAGLVAACPTLTLVVTSRERLRLAAETAWPVPPLASSDAEQLFVERARSAGVLLIEDETVAELCRRLDELPLALELAAARTVVFSPAHLLERLSHCLDLLKGGRDADPRQRTLRATIAWSHDLLTADEQALFRRMSVFAGGCSFESAEQVAGADADLLQSLLDKSLLRRRDAEPTPRFWMLETIREFAAEELDAAAEADDMQRRHLEHYAALAEDCYDETLRGNHDLDRLEQERENLRLALDAALATEPELALELAPNLLSSWTQRGGVREGREKMAAALSNAPDAPAPARARALFAAARLASDQSDHDVADSLGWEALALFREFGDQREIGLTLNRLGMNAFWRGDYGKARRLFEEAAEALRASGDGYLQIYSSAGLAHILYAEGDYARAITLYREVVATMRREGANNDLSVSLNNLGVAEEAGGETEQAKRSFEESVALSRQGAPKQGLAYALASLAHIMRASAPADAFAHYSESLRLAREMEETRLIAYCLEGGASIIAARGNSAHAASLLGAASAIRTKTGAALTPDEQTEVDTVEGECREALSDEAFSRAWEEGAALDANAAADWALQLGEETG